MTASRQPAFRSTAHIALWFVAALLGMRLATLHNALAETTADLPKRIRRPAALVHFRETNRLYVAQRRGGGVSLVDTETLTTIAEFAIGEGLSDLKRLPETRYLLVADERRHAVLLAETIDARLTVVDRVSVGPDPVGLTLTADGARCCVASLWSRQVSVVDVSATPAAADSGHLRVSSIIQLPFAPLKLLMLGNEKLLAAEAFGGRVAVVDIDSSTVESVRSLPAHNIRGMALDRENQRVWISHQTLNRLARADFDDIHWGTLLTNNLRELDVNALLDPQADLLTGSRLVHVGEATRGAGDPTDVAIAGKGQLLVSLSGVRELAISKSESFGFDRITVGRRPGAIVVDTDTQRAFVANAHSDTVSVIDLESKQAVTEISLGPQPEMTPVDQGERLFFDATLSHDGWMSCHSCHSDGHTNNQLADTLSDGNFGAPKRVLSLLGVGRTGPWAWNGSMSSLEEQLQQSINSTMHGESGSDEQIAALAAYLRSLAPPKRAAKAKSQARGSIERGGKRFTQLQCDRCHTPPTYTSTELFDVDLADESGRGRFNPPSLLGGVHRDAFLHDGSATSLKMAVLAHNRDKTGQLSNQDWSDLIAFLRSL